MADRCTNCDREACDTKAALAAFVACACPVDMRNPCPHQRYLNQQQTACEAHAVNWRERALAAERWIPVTERLPEVWQDVLVAWDGTVLTAYMNAAGTWCERYGEQPIAVTLWRPLPTPPEGE